MIQLSIILFLTSLVVSFVNVNFAKIDSYSLSQIFKTALIMLPFQFLISVGFAYYYSKGIVSFSYATLNISSYAMLISFGLLSQFIFFKTHTFTLYEIIGLVFTSIGLFFFMLNKI